MGLSRGQRITDKAVFRQAFQQGKRRAGKLLVMWIREGSDARLRLGVIASKKTFNRSVDRSRAKRLLREGYRTVRSSFREGADIVLVARRSMLDAGMSDVQAELMRLAAETGMLRCGKDGNA